MTQNSNLTVAPHARSLRRALTVNDAADAVLRDYNLGFLSLDILQIEAPSSCYVWPDISRDSSSFSRVFLSFDPNYSEVSLLFPVHYHTQSKSLWRSGLIKPRNEAEIGINMETRTRGQTRNAEWKAIVIYIDRHNNARNFNITTKPTGPVGPVERTAHSVSVHRFAVGGPCSKIADEHIVRRDATRRAETATILTALNDRDSLYRRFLNFLVLRRILRSRDTYPSRFLSLFLSFFFPFSLFFTTRLARGPAR